MTVTVKTLDGKTLLFLKGAVDVLMHRCAALLTEEGSSFLSRQKKAEILEQNERMAGEALRVIGFAFKELPFGTSSREEQDFTFIGLAGMIDPPLKRGAQSHSHLQ